MQIALIHMENGEEPDRKNTEDALAHSIMDAHNRNLEREHALAIARYMRDGGRLAPLLICPKGSQLEKDAAGEGIPTLALSQALNPLALFPLWRWQKRHAWLPILCLGQKGLPLARRLAGMRKHQTWQLNTAFFQRAPDKDKIRELSLASHCLCGSSFVAEKIEAMWKEKPGKGGLPPFVECQPGMNLENYNFSPPEYNQAKDMAEEKHFVFGMADSLLPRSGAMLVARAMAAIWQRDDLPRWEMRMSGGGSRFGEILGEAKALGVISRLAILNEQPLAEVTRHCHGWIAPCASDAEFPPVLWAGYAARLPVICARSSLHRERTSFTQANTALRVDPDNPQEMAKAMIAVMRDERLRKRMSQGDEAIRRHISLLAMAERVVRHLESWLPPKAADSEEIKPKTDPDKQ